MATTTTPLIDRLDAAVETTAQLEDELDRIALERRRLELTPEDADAAAFRVRECLGLIKMARDTLEQELAALESWPRA